MTSLDQIAAIADAAEATDGSAPLDEATWFALRRDSGVRSWVQEDGFALLAGDDLSLVVHPEARGRGLGGALARTALAAADRPGLRAWSHCDHPAAVRLARRHGFERVRELWVMRRPATAPLPDVPAPEGTTLRAFRPGDEPEVVRVNRAAFAGHPEQAAMDAANLAERMAQPWFDPAGLLVAERDGRLVGFHWTKQHSARLGEVYVIGVDPEAQGGGLGRALTYAGLRHLAARGVREVMLYVESDNAAAVALYSGIGFGHAEADTHVMYRS